MKHAANSEVWIIGLGLMPLLIATLWLVLLRDPKPAAAYVSLPTEVRDERWREAAGDRTPTRFVGVVVAGREARLGAELAGTDRSRVRAQAGARVQRGDPLVQLTATAVAGAEGLAQAQAELDRSTEQAAELVLASARDKTERMQRARDAYSERDLAAAQNETRRAQAELDRLRANSAVQRTMQRRELLRAKLQTVRAPFDAVVADCAVAAGDVVPAGAELVRVVDDARFVRFAVPSAELSRLRIGSSLHVAARGAAATWTATLIGLQPEIDAANALGFGRAELTRPSSADPGLWPGTRVDVAAVRGEHEHDAMKPDANALFRRQAVEFHRRGGLRGDLLRITPTMLDAVQWLLIAIVIGGLCFVCSAEIRRHASGPAVVWLEQRYDVTADRAGVVVEIVVRVGQRVQAGDALLRWSAPREASELAAAEREFDDQLLQRLREPADPSTRQTMLELRARRENARNALERCVLRAPQAGEVVDLHVRVGQWLEAGTPILALQAEPHGAEVIALLPGADRPLIRAGMPLWLRFDGFEHTSLELQVERVDEQALGPNAALRATGTELAGAFEVVGPVVLVHARVPAHGFVARGFAHRLHHGMLAHAELALERERLLYAWLPSLQRALSDVL